MPSKITINWLLNDIWYYLFIVCFDWKIRVFQQTAVMVYYILKEECSWNFFKIYCKSTCAGISFLIKMKVEKPSTLSRSDFGSGVFL